MKKATVHVICDRCGQVRPTSDWRIALCNHCRAAAVEATLRDRGSRAAA